MVKSTRQIRLTQSSPDAYRSISLTIVGYPIYWIELIFIIRTTVLSKLQFEQNNAQCHPHIIVN